MELKKITEIVSVGGVLAVAMTASLEANAAATAVSSAATARSAVSVASGAAGGYVVQGFNLTISAHTSMQYDGDTTAAAVNAANSKGMHTFGGSTAGGSVAACETTSVSVPTAKAPTGPSNGC